MSREAICPTPEHRSPGVEILPFDDLVQRHGRTLRGRVRKALVRRGLPARDDHAQELVQEVYCRLLENRGQRWRACRGRTDQQVAAYLNKVAERVVLDHLRSSAASKRGADFLIPAGDGPGQLPEVADPGASPEDRLLSQERRREFLALCRAAARGRAQRRNFRILRLALLEGHSSREIAALVDGKLTPSGIDTVVHRLRARLARAGIVLPDRQSV